MSEIIHSASVFNDKAFIYHNNDQKVLLIANSLSVSTLLCDDLQVFLTITLVFRSSVDSQAFFWSSLQNVPFFC